MHPLKVNKRCPRQDGIPMNQEFYQALQPLIWVFRLFGINTGMDYESSFSAIVCRIYFPAASIFILLVQISSVVNTMFFLMSPQSASLSMARLSYYACNIATIITSICVMFILQWKRTTLTKLLSEIGDVTIDISKVGNTNWLRPIRWFNAGAVVYCVISVAFGTIQWYVVMVSLFDGAVWRVIHLALSAFLSGTLYILSIVFLITLQVTIFLNLKELQKMTTTVIATDWKRLVIRKSCRSNHDYSYYWDVQVNPRSQFMATTYMNIHQKLCSTVKTMDVTFRELILLWTAAELTLLSLVFRALSLTTMSIQEVDHSLDSSMALLIFCFLVKTAGGAAVNYKVRSVFDK